MMVLSSKCLDSRNWDFNTLFTVHEEFYLYCLWIYVFYEMVCRTKLRVLIAVFSVLLITYHVQHTRRTALLVERHNRRTRKNKMLCSASYYIPRVNKDVSEILDGKRETTIRYIGMTCDSFKAICQMLPPKCQGWSREFEVAVFLLWLARGTSYEVIGEEFSIPRSTTHVIVKYMLREIKLLVVGLVKFPIGERLDVIGNGFAHICRSTIFKKAVGALHNMHVCVMKSPNLHSSYLNRKLFHSIQLQCLCDHEGYFINIFCGSPGSLPDARVLKLSALYRQSVYPPPGYFIIGGGSYPNLESPLSLVTPFKNEEEFPKAAFNQSLKRGLSVAERTSKMLKLRWKNTFRKALPVEMAVDVTVVCAILHNICMSVGDVLHLDEYSVVTDKRSVPLNNPVTLRDQLLANHFPEKG